MNGIGFRRAVPQDHAWIVARHATLYAQTDGFDDSFGPLVARILALWSASHDPLREVGIMAERAGHPLGTVFCTRAEPERTAKLRLFLIEPEARGTGLGRQLLRLCLGFAQAAGYERMTLWTHESHHAACALYRSEGFDLVRSGPVRSFGQDLVEQHWQIALPGRDLPAIPLAIAGGGR